MLLQLEYYELKTCYIVMYSEIQDAHIIIAAITIKELGHVKQHISLKGSNFNKH